MPSLARAMLRSPGSTEAPERCGTAVVPVPQRALARRGAAKTDPEVTLALVQDAAAAFETLQLRLLTVLQTAKTSLTDAEAERAELRGEIAALAREKEGWSQRAREAEAMLDRAKDVLHTQQGMLEKALAREREAVQRAYMLELKMRQAGPTQRPA